MYPSRTPLRSARSSRPVVLAWSWPDLVLWWPLAVRRVSVRTPLG
ncbi:hypothetical protein [Humibacillus xanthopallidus]